VRSMKALTTGTTTAGVVLRNAVVLAADKRATAGTYIAHKKVRKILVVDDHIAVTTAGLVADNQMLASLLRNVAKQYKISHGVPISVKALASYLGLLLNTYKYYPFIVQMLVGGIDETGPHLYQVEWFGDHIEEKYAVTGSGSYMAIAVLEQGYRPDMSIEEAKDLLQRAVSASIARDAFSGEAVDIAVITAEGITIETRPALRLSH